MRLIKKILKSILPTPLLKKCFLYYNFIKIHTTDKILFPELKFKTADFFLYRKGYPFKENGISIDKLENLKVQNSMQYWCNWTQEEFILKYSGLTILEPEFGWGISKKNKLNFYSLGFSRTSHQKKPSVVNLILSRKREYIHKCISFRDTGEENYFHFFNDVLTKLFFLKKHKLIDISVPLIISSKLFKKDFFQYFLNYSSLKNYNWHIQDKDTYIHTNDILFCKPMTHRIDLLNEIIDEINIPKNNLQQNRKIYLTRKNSTFRYVSNESEFLPFLKEKGYEIIDSSDLNFSEQIQLFSQCSNLIGVHGAGMTNMMFRRGGAMNVTELFSAYHEQLPFHYIMLAQMFDFKYQALIGEKSKEWLNGGFIINRLKIQKKIIL